MTVAEPTHSPTAPFAPRSASPVDNLAGPLAAISALRLTNVTVHREGRRIVDHVSFDLAPGQTLSLAGPNGGGKTTLLRAVLGFTKSTGTIQLLGATPRQIRRMGHRVGYVPQRPTVPAALPLSVRQALKLSLPRGEDASVVDAVLVEVMGDVSLAETPITRLSGGQLQQVFLAKALVGGPGLLLLDEPTVGLDRPAVDRLVTLLDRRRVGGLATLIATHDHLTATRLTGELAYLDRRLEYRGPADQVPDHLDRKLCHHN